MSNLIAACVGDMHVCPIKGHGSSPHHAKRLQHPC